MSNPQNQPKPKMPMRGPGGGHGHGAHGMAGGEKAKNFKGTIKKLIAYLKKYALAILVAIVCAAAGCVFSIVGPKILGNATNEILTGYMAQIAGTGSIDFDAIAKILWTLLGLYLLSAVLTYAQGFLMSGVSTKISYSMRRDINLKISRMPLSAFDRMSHGEVLSRITNDVDTVTQTLNQSLSQMITSIVTVVGVLIMMISISPVMTLVALCTLPLSAFVMIAVVKKSQPLFKRQQETLGNVNGHVEEMYGGHLVVRAFNGEEKSMETFETINKELYHSAWKSQFFGNMMMPLMNFISNLGYVAVCVLGGFLTLSGRITVGEIQSFIMYVRNFNQPMQQIGSISNVLQQTAAAAERVFEFLEQPEESAQGHLPAHTETVHGDVTFKNVSFGYVPEKTIIKNFSSEVHQGQKIAIVGPTGAGKTTIVKLLMRFYDVNSGSILIDGKNIEEIPRDTLRSMFGMVLQDTWLYHDTIMENIRYGRLDATDEEVIAAAKAAQVHHFINVMPEGYNTVLNEEASNISAGQKQLLTIARTILSDPKLLILDEATSSVDTRTEASIQKAMDLLMQGRTSFVIAHRLSTIRNADLILVLKDGDIVETGTHESLLAKGAFYAELYNAQFASNAQTA